MADPLNNFIVWAGQNEPVVLIAGGTAFALYLLVQKMDKRNFGDFKPKALEDRVIPDLKYRINTLGQKSDKELKIGRFNKIGNVHKFRDMEYPNNKKITIKRQSKEEKSKEVEVQEVRAFLMTPENKMKKIIWFITDIILGEDLSTKILVAFKKPIETDYDAFILPEDSKFKNKGGVLVQKGTATDNVINDIAKQDAEEGVWEGIPNFVEKINHLMPQHSQDIERVEAAKEEDEDLI